MKQTLSITVTNEDGPHALTPYLQADAYASFLWDWEQYMRGICKHGSEEDQKTTWDTVREKWFEMKHQAEIREVP